MGVTVVVMTDGRRDCIVRAIESLKRLHGPITVRMIHDDSGDAAYASWLWEQFGDRYVIHSTGKRQGFAGAMRSAREWVAEHDRNPYVWWHEDDFVLTREIDLHDFAAALDDHPHVVQMALERQPINERERAAGGVVRQWLPAVEVTDWYGATFRQVRACFTTNPSLIPRHIITDYEWPEGSESEGRFGLALFASDSRLMAGYIGGWDDALGCEHIGAHRVGTGY